MRRWNSGSSFAKSCDWKYSMRAMLNQTLARWSRIASDSFSVKVGSPTAPGRSSSRARP